MRINRLFSVKISNKKSYVKIIGLKRIIGKKNEDDDVNSFVSG
jgi:hypothetical protein